MADLRLEVVGRIGRLAADWDAMVDALPKPVPFLRSWWLDALAGDDARIVVLFAGDRLVGGLALERDRPLGVERLRMLGRALTPDHMDLVAVPSARLDVVDALRAWFARPGARIIDLEGVADPSFVRAALPPPVGASVDHIARWGSVHDDEPLKRLGRQLGRVERRLAREGVTMGRVPPPQVARAVDDLLRLNALRFEDASLLTPHAAAFRAVARAGAPSGEFRCYEARAGDHIAGVEALGLVDGRCATIQGGRDPDPAYRGVGRALLAFAIRDCVNDGATVVDLLRGADEWKADWGRSVGRVLRLRASRGRLGAVAEQSVAAGVWAYSRVRRP